MGMLAALTRLLCGPGDSEVVERSMRELREDKLGDRLHLLAGCALCLCASAPVPALELAAAVAVGVCVIRAGVTWRYPLVLLRAPAVWALAVWAAWLTISLAWSGDRSHGLWVLGELRWATLFLAVGPLVHHKRLLLVCWAAGYLIGHATQAVHVVGMVWDGAPDWMTFGRSADRVSGWWEPVSGGTILCAVLGLHLAVVLCGRGVWKWIGSALALFTLVGIVLTGTRGAWIAAALMMLGTTPWIAWRILRGRHAIVWIAAVVGGVALLVGGALLTRGAWQTRVNDAVSEIECAVGADSADAYDSNIGGRVLMAKLAVDLFERRPVTGVGVGGYQRVALVELRDMLPRDADRLEWRVHDHAHSTMLHLLATTGVIGFGLWVLAVGVVLFGSFRGWGEDETGITRGVGLALVGLILAGLFETLHTGTRVTACFWLLAALAWSGPPRSEEPIRSAS